MALSTKDENDPNRLVKIKFLVNTSDDGEEYGPDYPKKTAQIPFRRAAGYIRQGRAEAVSADDELKEVQEATDAANQPPEETGRKKK
ncbi:MAG TPA: hypothetical protein VF521_11720 [Pyrinomonadaceae bacterium]